LNWTCDASSTFSLFLLRLKKQSERLLLKRSAVRFFGKAITSSISGAISSATQGGDPVTGAERGFIGGAVGGTVGQAVSGAPAEIDPVTGVTEAPATGLASTNIPSDVSKSVSRGAGSAASGFATGLSPKQALVGGLVTGGLDYAYSDQPSNLQTSAEKSVIGKGLTDYFAPSTTYRTAQTEGGSGAPTSVTTTGAGQAPGSQALAQALRIGDPGAPILALVIKRVRVNSLVGTSVL
jgi:hypothetical protein